MQQHYNLTDEVFAELKTQITTMDMINSMSLFAPPVERKRRQTNTLLEASQTTVSKLSLMYYVDSQGDFTTSGKSSTKLEPHQLLAKAVFKSLELSEQMEVLEYISFTIHGDEDGD